MLQESPESSSPIVTRAVAAGLKGKHHTTYAIQPWQRPLLRLLGYFPQIVAQYTISRFQTVSGLKPGVMADFELDQVTENRLKDYDHISGQFDTITIGPALGGASTHLSLAMRSPFLPVAFVFTLQGGAVDGDVLSYLNRSADLSLNIARRNPEVITIQHFDPIHDGWLTKYVNHLRLKLIDLPSAYKKFIHSCLKPQGTICYLDCGAQWLRYPIGERSFLQVGGWGDIHPHEYLEGSERIDQYRRSAGLKAEKWNLEGITPENGSESEWGCEAGLAGAVEEFCTHNGYQFARIAFPEPNDYSSLAYRAIAYQLQREGRQPAGVLVEMFTQFDASAVISSGLLPLWLIFNTRDSLAYLLEMRENFPDGKPVFFSPLATFSITPDIAPWSDWESALRGFEWINIGTRSSHYPADPWTLLDWEKPLWRWVERNYHPIDSALHPQDLLML